jgi:hypothetical protein
VSGRRRPEGEPSAEGRRDRCDIGTEGIGRGQDVAVDHQLLAFYGGLIEQSLQRESQHVGAAAAVVVGGDEVVADPQ